MPTNLLHFLVHVAESLLMLHLHHYQLLMHLARSLLVLHLQLQPLVLQLCVLLEQVHNAFLNYRLLARLGQHGHNRRRDRASTAIS